MKIFYFFLILSLIISSCASSDKADEQKEPSVLYKEAEEKIKKGSYEEARESLKKVIERDAEKSYSPVAQIRTADSYYDEGKFDEAIEEYKRFLSLYPHNKYASYVQYQIGMSHFKQIENIDRGHEHLEGAIREFENLIRNYPRNPFIEEAKERLKKCRDMAAEYEFYIGKYYFKKESYNAAVSRFEGIIKKYPQSSWVPEALYYLGLSYKESGNIEKAKESLKRLTSEYPNYRYNRDAEKTLSRLEEKR
ncbi:MAG: outer membrane protein assembly factor BamD [Nitrospirota bacterium]